MANRQGDRSRDSQRSKVYKYETFGDTDAARMRFESMDVLRAEVRRVLMNPRLKKKYGYSEGWVNCVEVMDGRGRSSACAYPGILIMKFPKWSRKPSVIAHEIAHLLAHNHYGGRIAWHGWEFCATFLDVAKYGYGQEAHDALLQGFKRGRVQYKQKVKRELSPERREELRSRMAEVRARKALA